jgi:hypothetical protein
MGRGRGRFRRNMTLAAERPAWRISFRALMGIVFLLFAVAAVAGRYVYGRYAGYRPLALAHVPSNLRYRARVALSDRERVEAVAPLLRAADPRGTRRAALERNLGVSLQAAAKEVAFGVGADPNEFVIVLGLSPGAGAGTGTSAAKAVCDAAAVDGIRLEATPVGCRFADGTVVGGAGDGAVVVASREPLMKGLLEVPDLGDRLGFSGPSVRGTAPETGELRREVSAFAPLLASKYP